MLYVFARKFGYFNRAKMRMFLVKFNIISYAVALKLSIAIFNTLASLLFGGNMDNASITIQFYLFIL